jgi:hypothetical protein
MEQNVASMDKIIAFIEFSVITLRKKEHWMPRSKWEGVIEMIHKEVKRQIYLVNPVQRFPVIT